jgi:Predicted Zn-dependent proteases and their inactivated homologs
VASEIDVYKALSRLKALGYQAEVFHTRLSEYAIEFDGSIRSETLEDEGYGLRVAKDGKMGFAYSTRLTEELIERAIQGWRVSKVDEANVIPPGESGITLSLVKFDLEKAIEEVRDSFPNLLEVPEWASVSHAGAEVALGEIEVASTEGSDKRSKATFSSAYIEGNAKVSSGVSPSVHSSSATRDLSAMRSDALKEDFLFKLEIAKNEVEPKSLPSVVTLTPEALQDLLLPLLRFAVSTDNVYRKSSPLKLGEDFGTKFTVIDDPTLDEMIMSREFDGEGLPSRKVEIISNGVFVRSINTYYWARKANVEPTHSAIRTYATNPTAGFSNVVIKVKEVGEEEGLVVNSLRGVHTSDFASGAFSLSVGLAWNPKEGKAVKGLNLSGTLRDLLRGIRAEAGDERTVWNLKSRSLVVEGLKLA